MSSTIIDRRLNPGSKSLSNRQKFLRRAKDQIKETIRKSIDSKDIKDIGNGEKVRIKNNKDISEPTFNHDPKTGNHKRVLPGNKEYSVGDKIQKPKNGQGRGGNGPGDGDSEDSFDEFEFTLTREEFIEYLFEDLELPDFVKESIKGANSFKTAREGFTSTGSPANLNIGQTFRKSIGRRLALHRPTDEEIEDLEKALQEAKDPEEREEIILELERLERRRKIIPFIEENDLKYNLWTKQPQPITKAVMFCLMDTSGSMGEFEKDIAKRFFLLLYLFLEKRYDNIDIRFIRHTTTAQEVDEKTFFYDNLTGGTTISSGLNLISDIIDRDYNPEQWNIYIAQASDGDNSYYDNPIVENIIINQLLPRVQYFAYIQARENTSTLTAFSQYSAWGTYQKLSEEHQKLVAKYITSPDQVWRVFRELFEKGK